MTIPLRQFVAVDTVLIFGYIIRQIAKSSRGQGDDSLPILPGELAPEIGVRRGKTGRNLRAV